MHDMIALMLKNACKFGRVQVLCGHPYLHPCLAMVDRQGGFNQHGIPADFFFSSGCQRILREPANFVASWGYTGVIWSDLVQDYQASRKGGEQKVKKWSNITYMAVRQYQVHAAQRQVAASARFQKERLTTRQFAGTQYTLRYHILVPWEYLWWSKFTIWSLSMVLSLPKQWPKVNSRTCW